MKSLASLFLLAVCLSWPSVAADAGPTAMNIIATRCRGCHNDQVRSSNLALTSAANLLKGGSRGPALIPGQPDQSLLLKLVSGGPPRMPLSGPPLSTAEIAIIRQWISQGAAWTDPEPWWSLKPLTKPPIPATQSTWAKTPIDSFILAKLKEKGLTASHEADRRTLIRRLTSDLHGLPPTIEEVNAFLADQSPNAYEKLVDRLLAGPSTANAGAVTGSTSFTTANPMASTKTNPAATPGPIAITSSPPSITTSPTRVSSKSNSPETHSIQTTRKPPSPSAS